MKIVSSDVSGSLRGEKAENDRIGYRITLRGALPSRCEANAIDDNGCLRYAEEILYTCSLYPNFRPFIA